MKLSNIKKQIKLPLKTKNSNPNEELNPVRAYAVKSDDSLRKTR